MLFVNDVSIMKVENGFVVQARYTNRPTISFIAKNYKEIQKTLAKIFDEKEPE